MSRIVVIGTSILGCSILMALVQLNEGDKIAIDPDHHGPVRFIDTPTYVFVKPKELDFCIEEPILLTPDLGDDIDGNFRHRHFRKSIGNVNTSSKFNGRKVMRTRNNC